MEIFEKNKNRQSNNLHPLDACKELQDMINYISKTVNFNERIDLIIDIQVRSD